MCDIFILEKCKKIYFLILALKNKQSFCLLTIYVYVLHHDYNRFFFEFGIVNELNIYCVMSLLEFLCVKVFFILDFLDTLAVIFH